MPNALIKFRRGKNEIDSWLDSMGYYRKNIAYDETCLFRAAAEQLFYTQVFHERVRKECVDYARQNFSEFAHLFTDKKEFEQHLEDLSKHMVVCGDREINMISQTYGRSIVIFNGATFNFEHRFGKSFADVLRFCLVGKDHYDVVHTKEHIITAGFCQSIVYGIVYERVLNVKNVSEIVHQMLYEKPPASANSYLCELDECTNEDVLDVPANVVAKTECPFPFYRQPLSSAPFPYKIAKALDPNIYRNIEYDTWVEVRREMRIGEWYYGDNNLVSGASCNLHTEDGVLKCYIQEIHKGEGKCLVFITSTAEKRLVDYDALSPEDDAKPWPLPYRFSKNLVVTTPPHLLVDKKSFRRRREKRDVKSEDDRAQPENDVTAFEGCPLQIQVEAENGQEEASKATLTSTQPEEWDGQWPKAPQVSAQQVVWSQGPVTPTVYGAQEAITYDVNATSSSYIYTYPTTQMPTTPSNSPTYVWPTSDYIMSPPVVQQMASPVIYMETSPTHHASSHHLPPLTIPPPNMPSLQMPPTPQSPQYPMYTIPPPTPVYFSTPEVQQVPLFSPTVDSAQYLSPNYGMGSQTWYPPGVDPQGFVFPYYYGTK